MSADRFTRCPHCKATFKVSEEQLGIANGRVRCGACMNVFDAIAYTVSTPSSPNADHDAAAPEDAAPEIETTISEPVELDKDLESEEVEKDEWLIQDDPDEDKEEDSYSGTRLSDELSTSFMELDKDAGSRPYDPYSTEVSDAEEPEKSNDESWAEEMLDDMEEEPATKRQEPVIPDQAVSEEAQEKQSERFIDSTESKSEPLRFYYEQDADKGSMPWLKTGVLATISLILMVVLLAQASWFHYEKLAKYPHIKSLYEQACDVLKCELPELIDVSKIRSHNLVVRSHPTARNALIIDAVIVNDADYVQPFPNLALYFSDINNNTVAQRLIKPKEYLSADFFAPDQMPSQQPVHISLEILDPGKEAVNYKLKLFPAD